ncbi:MAG: zf-HC2 domain-containing protein [Planctomycetes bacterium]|nr:zf-HC2 domain-containing protein [Planctomycetota bacterium]
MNCRDILPLIHDYADAELEAETRARIQSHLQACPACEKVHGEIARLKRLVREKARAPRLPLEFSSRWASGGRISVSWAASFRALARRRLRRGLAAAAAGFLLVAGGWLLYSVLLRPSPPPLAHAEAMREFALRFDAISGAGGASDEEKATLRAIRDQTGIALDSLPSFKGARLRRWTAVSISSHSCVRLDYGAEDRPPGAAAGQASPPVFSIFAIPLKSIESPGCLKERIEATHLCECVGVQGMTLLCFRDKANSLNLVSRVEPKKLFGGYLSGWKCGGAEGRSPR